MDRGARPTPTGRLHGTSPPPTTSHHHPIIRSSRSPTSNNSPPHRSVVISKSENKSASPQPSQRQPSSSSSSSNNKSASSSSFQGGRGHGGGGGGASRTDQYYWVPHDQLGYVAARLVGYDEANGYHMLEMLSDKGSLLQLPKDKLKECSLITNLEEVVNTSTGDDLSQLEDTSSPSVLHHLRHRLMNSNKTYTQVGPRLLLSLNPNKPMPDMSSPEVYSGAEEGLSSLATTSTALSPLEPHVFGMAHQAYVAASDTNTSQAIIILGECGAGKTETAKRCLAYLLPGSAKDTATTPNLPPPPQNIAKALSLLEAFGNAKTVLNNNSSRYGRWVRVHYERGVGGTLTFRGGSIDTYLLEQSRVSGRFLNANERNFHALYQLCSAAQEDGYQYLKLQPCSLFGCLRGGQCTLIEGIDDAASFRNTCMALQDLNFATLAEQQSIWRILAVILHASNIDFEETNSSTEPCRISPASQASLKLTAELMGVPSASVDEALRSQDVIIKGEATRSYLRIGQAEKCRDAICEALYQRLWSWLVSRVNDAIAVEGQGLQPLTIGVLDMPGFECLEINSLEQLCINLVDERLQQHFNNCVFKVEQELYLQEGVVYQAEEKNDDKQPILDLLEQKQTGVFPLLEEEAGLPNGSDESFMSKVLRCHKTHPSFKKDPTSSQSRFVVKHYAGDVLYDAKGFAAKDKGPQIDSLSQVLSKSSLSLLAQLFPKRRANNSRCSPSSSRTVPSVTFRGQLNGLMAEVRGADQHFIRCIRTSSQCGAHAELDGHKVLAQLRYGGILPALQMVKKGYPYHKTYRQFFLDHWPVVKGGLSLWNLSESYGERCKLLVSALQSLHPAFHDVMLGERSRVLYRGNVHKALTAMTRLCRAKAVITVQRAVRGHMSRKRSRAMINARKQIRNAIARRDYTLLEPAMERANDMGYKWSEVHEASTLCLVLQAESDARKELQKLVEIIHHKLGQPDYDVVEYVSPYLQQMVNYTVQDLHMSWDPIVQEARAQMVGVVEYATALQSLRAAIHQLDLPSLKASVNAVVRAQERLGDFCAQDVTIARQWITKLDNEDHAVQVLETLLSECLLSPFLPGSGEPTKDQLSDVTTDRLFNRDKGEDLEVAYDFLQQTAPVTPAALSLLEEAKGLIHLRSLAEDKMWEALQAKIGELRALESNNDLDGSSAVLTPRVKAELRCYEIVYAAHVLLPPLLAALNQGQAVGTVGEVDMNAVEAGLGVLFEALNDMVASWQYGIWLQSIHAQANEAYRLRCAWLAQDWVGMEAAVKAGQELIVGDLIDAELTMAALEVSDRNNQMKLRGLIATEGIDVAANGGALKPLSSDDIVFLKTLRALAEELPHCLSKITKRLLGSMVFLDDVRRCILESKWFHLYKFYYGLEILYEDCDDNTELEAMEELSQFVRILDTACQPIVEATRLLATTRLLLDTLKPPLDCGRTTGSATGLRFAAPDMNDSLRDVIDYCRGLQHLNAAAEELIAIAEVVLDVRETGTSASSNSIDGVWADLQPKLVQHSQWIDYLVEGELADPLDVRLEVTLIRSHVQFQATFNSLVIALGQGGPSGLPEALDVSKIDVQALEQALAGFASLLSNEAHGPYFLEEEQAAMASWQTYASAIFHVRRHLQRDEMLPALEAIRDVSLTSAAIKLNEDLAASLQRELKEVQDHISTEVTVKLCQQALAFTRGVPPEKRDASCLEQSKKMVDYAKEIGQRYGFKGAEAQELHGSIIVLSDLRAAQLAGDMDAMSDLLERCEQLEVVLANSTLIVELELARKQIADEISLKQIRTALAIGRIKGRAGNLNTANVRVDQLEQALSLSSESDGCSYGLIYMQQLAQAVITLRCGVAEWDTSKINSGLGQWEGLKAWIAPYAGARLASIIQEEMKLAWSELLYRQMLDQGREEIAIGAAQGDVGALDLSSVSTKGLEDLLEVFERDSPGLDIPDLLTKTIKSCRIVLALRQGLQAGQWEDVGVALREAAKDPLMAELYKAEAHLVREEYDDQLVYQSLTRAIKTGGAEGAPGSLSYGRVRTKDLQAAIRAANDLKRRSKRVEVIMEGAKLLLAIRKLLLPPPQQKATSQQLSTDKNEPGAHVDWPAVLELLGQAPHLPGEAYELIERECKRLEDDVAVVEIKKVLLQSFVTGKAAGRPGKLDVSVVRLEELDAAITQASSPKIESSDLDTLIDAAKSLRSLRAAIILVYQDKSNEESWQVLRRSLDGIKDVLQPKGANHRTHMGFKAALSEMLAIQDEYLIHETQASLTMALRGGLDAYNKEDGTVYPDKLALELLQSSLATASRLAGKNALLDDIMSTGRVLVNVRALLSEGKLIEAQKAVEQAPVVTKPSSSKMCMQEELSLAQHVIAWQMLVGVIASEYTEMETGHVKLTTKQLAPLQEAINYASKSQHLTDGQRHYLESVRLLLRLRYSLAGGNTAERGQVLQEAHTKLDDLPKDIKDQIVLIEQESTYREVINGFELALRTGGASGTPGALCMATIYHEILQQALTQSSKRVKHVTARLQKYYESAQIIISLRQAQQQGDKAAIRSLLVRAASRRDQLMPLAIKEIQLAEMDLENGDAVDALDAVLKSSQESTDNDLARLEQAISTAEKVRKLHPHGQVLLTTTKVILHLRVAMRAGNWVGIQEMLTAIDKEPDSLDTMAMDEIALIRYQLQAHNAMVTLEAQLHQGRIPCGHGLIVPSPTSTKKLQAAVLPLSTILSTPDGRLTEAMMSQIEDLVAEATDLIKIRQHVLRGQYIEALKLTQDALYIGRTTHCQEELNSYLEGLKIKVRYDFLSQRIMSCSATLDYQGLRNTVRQALYENMGKSPEGRYLLVLNHGLRLILRFQQTYALLRIVGSKQPSCLDLTALERALVDSQALHIKCEARLEAINWMKRLWLAEKSIQRTLLTLDPQQVEEAHAAVQASGLPEIKGCGLGIWLVKLPLDSLFELQLQLALNQGKRDTALSLLLKVKNSNQHEHSRDAHEEPQEWPAYSTTPLTKPLTNLDPITTVIALRMFCFEMLPLETSQSPLKHQEEILRLGGKVPALRDEIYCQIMKQLTDHPNKASSDRLWDLMRVCTQAFSPSDKIEAKLERFLMQQGRDELVTDLMALAIDHTISAPTASTHQLGQEQRAGVSQGSLRCAVYRAVADQRSQIDDLLLHDEIQPSSSADGHQGKRNPPSTLEEDLLPVFDRHGRIDKTLLLKGLNSGKLKDIHFKLSQLLINGLPKAASPNRRSSKNNYAFTEGQIDNFWHSTIEPRYPEVKHSQCMKLSQLVHLLCLAEIEGELLEQYRDMSQLATLPALAALPLPSNKNNEVTRHSGSPPRNLPSPRPIPQKKME